MPGLAALRSLSIFVLVAAVARTEAVDALACQSASTDAATFVKTALDYIVVGGGNGGMALAARLSETSGVQVGVIEAGSLNLDHPLIDIPGRDGAALGNASYDWGFQTVPQPAANNRSLSTPRGKMIGGTTGLNFMIWCPASKPEYDAWDSFQPGWNWDKLVPYMKKSFNVFPNQTNPIPGLSAASASLSPYNTTYEGVGGPIQASFNEYYADPAQPYIKTVNSLGIKSNPNPDNGDTEGVHNSRLSINRYTGTRSYSAPAYYCPASSRSNLHVLTGAQATRIILSKKGANVTATGVQFVSGSTTYTANVAKEVILAAGAYQTPQLLELSGIGNATLLKSLNISTVVDLPGVGENLQDHLYTPLQFQVKPGVQTLDVLRVNSTFAAEAAAEYAANKTGILTASDSIITFFTFDALRQNNSDALLRAFDASTAGAKTQLQGVQYGIQRQWIEHANVPQLEFLLFNKGRVSPAANTSYVSIFVGIMHPLSRGTVHINTTNPLAIPVNSPNYLSKNYDIAAMLAGVKYARSLATIPPFSDLLADGGITPSGTSDEDLTSWIRQAVGSGWHPAGTAAMAARELGGVVDSNLKVYGTTNVRVVDASIAPLHLGAHLQSTIYAIAEKAADIIKSQS